MIRWPSSFSTPALTAVFLFHHSRTHLLCVLEGFVKIQDAVFFQQRKTVANTELVVILPVRSLVQRQQFSESRSRERENNNLDSFATNLPSYTG